MLLYVLKAKEKDEHKQVIDRKYTQGPPYKKVFDDP